jgi:hypothetical protein
MAQPMEKNTIARRYSNIVALDAGIIKNGSSVSCRGAVQFVDAYKAELTIYLQRSSNGGSSYTDYKVVARDVFYSDGSHQLFGTATGLSGDYMYRTKVIVKVYNSSGSVIDSGTAYSNPT